MHARQGGAAGTTQRFCQKDDAFGHPPGVCGALDFFADFA